jgi:hypothetical protein
MFNKYLYHLVDTYLKPTSVIYQTSIPDRPQRTISSKCTDDPVTGTKALRIRTLSPAFYSRFVHYSSTSEAIDRECFFTEVKNRTLWASRPEILSAILSKRDAGCPTMCLQRTYLEELRWSVMKELRCPPAKPAYNTAQTSASFEAIDIRTFPYSDLDSFVRQSFERRYAGQYRRMVTKIFLAQRFTFGFTEAVDLVDLFLRVLLCWFGTVNLTSAVSMSEQVIRDGNQLMSVVVNQGVGHVLVTTMFVSSLHLYAAAKGYS